MNKLVKESLVTEKNYHEDYLSDEEIKARFVGKHVDKQIDKLTKELNHLKEIKDSFDSDFKKLKEKLNNIENIESVSFEEPHSSGNEKFLIRIKFLSGLFGNQSRKEIIEKIKEIVNFINNTKSMKVSSDIEYGDIFFSSDDEVVVWVI